MKKIFTLVAFVALTAGMVNAQSSCTPDPQYTGSGIFPTPLNAQFDGEVNLAYSEALTVNVPADTTIDLSALIGFPLPPVTVTINYQEVTGMTGLPTGLSYACDTTTCTWLSGTSGCVEISGTPTVTGQYTVSMTGNMNITVPASVPVIGGSVQDIPTPLAYQIEITQIVGVDPAGENTFTLSQNAPNPFGGASQIKVFVPTTSDLSFEVFDLNGKSVYAKKFGDVTGQFKIELNADELNAGVYFYSLSNGTDRLIRKMVVTH